MRKSLNFHFLIRTWFIGNRRIPCHFDCVIENCGYAVRGTRNEINSKSQTILEAGYAVRGTWNEINSKSQTILEAGYAVRGMRKEFYSKCEAILEAGYAVRGTGKEINSNCEATLEAGYAVRGTQKEINSKSQTILEAGYAVRGTGKEMNSKCKSRLEAGYAVCGTRKVIYVAECCFWRLMAKERGIYYMFSVFVLISFGQCSFGSDWRAACNKLLSDFLGRIVFPRPNELNFGVWPSTL